MPSYEESLLELCQGHIQIYCGAADRFVAASSFPMVGKNIPDSITNPNTNNTYTLSEALEVLYNYHLQARCKNPRDLAPAGNSVIDRPRCNQDHRYEIPPGLTNYFDSLVRTIALSLYQILPTELYGESAAEDLRQLRLRSLPEFKLEIQYGSQSQNWLAKLEILAKPVESILWKKFCYSYELKSRGPILTTAMANLLQGFDRLVGDWLRFERALERLKNHRRGSRDYQLNRPISYQKRELIWKNSDGTSSICTAVSPLQAALLAMLKEDCRKSSGCKLTDNHSGECKFDGQLMILNPTPPPTYS